MSEHLKTGTTEGGIHRTLDMSITDPVIAAPEGALALVGGMAHLAALAVGNVVTGVRGRLHTLANLAKQGGEAIGPR